ncbi:MAG: hypothetical protein ACI8S6_001979 [Myxococcota bacterium]|jgi:hypothetical protein
MKVLEDFVDFAGWHDEQRIGPDGKAAEGL